MIQIKCRPVRNAWLEALYQNKVLEASEKTRAYADKLYFYNTLYAHLGEALHTYHPKSRGLKKFALDHGLSCDSSTEQWEAALKKEFHSDVILKPVAVMNTAGEEGLYLFSRQSILKEIENKNSRLMTALQRSFDYCPPLIETIASGEEFLLQEHIASLAGLPVIEKSKHYQEIRIHTFEGHVLIGGSYSRWLDNEISKEQYFLWAQNFVQDFLDQLPKDFLQGQAWALDVLVFENRTMRILEANTNRGKPGQWSGFLSRPELLGVYTRYIEKHKAVRFKGLAGFLLRHNLANFTKNFKKRYIEGIR